MISKRERNHIAARMDLINAVGSALKKNGFAKLGVNSVAAEANMDKTAIYRYFDDFKDLLRAYIDQQEYWLNSLKEIRNKKIEDMKGLIKLFFREQIGNLMGSEEFRQLIIWELADKDGIAAPITVKREIYSENILKQSREILNNCGINLNFILAVLIGGIYYVVIHKDKYQFCEVDLTKKSHKDELIRTLDWIVDLLFEKKDESNEIEKIVVRAHGKGMAPEDISEITGLSLERITELTK